MTLATAPSSAGQAHRLAQCGACGATVPVVSAHPDLAWYEYRGPGSAYSLRTCRHCLHHPLAHTPALMSQNPALTCTTFEPLIEGAAHDQFYCGCRGFD